MVRRAAAAASVLLVSLALVAAGCWSAIAQPRAPRLAVGAVFDRLVVYKGEGRMEAYGRGTLLRSYDVAVGSGGAGPKRYEGDRRTPEGEYLIDSRHHSHRFHRFLHVSYPNAEDRRRFHELRRAGQVPEGRGIGSAIGIHGQPTHPLGFLTFGDWTAGCIAVSDAEAEELYEHVAPNAISIRP